MLQNPYSSLIETHPISLAEPKSKYNLLSERHLQALWFEQKYFRNLVTSSGEPIQVLSPGIWNAEAGPDFRRCHLKIGNHELRGDVEIHFADESWHQHQHQIDSRYDQVILHLSLWRPSQDKELFTNSGIPIARSYLEDSLTIPLIRIVQLIDLDLYPYKKFLGSGYCARALFRNMPEEKIKTFFKHAAYWRLEKKRNYLKNRAHDPSQQILAGISMGLGYKNNTEAFLDLFFYLIQIPNPSEELLLAIGMGAFGYFEEAYQKKWSRSEKYCELKHYFEQFPHDKVPKIKISVNQVRPLNHPIRRLAYMIKLIMDKNNSGLYSRLCSEWNASWSSISHNSTWNLLRAKLISLIPAYEDNYWNRHYTFENEPRGEFIPLIGESLLKEILINTFLPLLQEKVNDQADPSEMNAFQQFFGSFRGSMTSKTKYLIHRFFGDTPKGAMLNIAITQQGAYQLHRDFCLHYEASCKGCPFVQRFQESCFAASIP